MDKYELSIKIEQIRKLIKRKDYNTAARIADTVDWNKIKSNAELMLAADAYEASGKLEKAREVLLYAYERTNIGRQIVFRLCKIATKLGDIEEAEDFYGEYVKLASNDSSKYILQYEIARARGNSLDVQIAILSKYLDEEMDDRWAYELAKLYHKAGNGSECAKMCDTILLWFSDGKYVERAIELKSLYAPLTSEQKSRMLRENIIPVIDRTDENLADSIITKETEQNIDVNDITVKDFSQHNRFDTMNIQKELAKSMSDIFENADESVEDTNDKTAKEDAYNEDEQADSVKENQEELEKTKEIVLERTKVFKPITKDMLREADIKDEIEADEADEQKADEQKADEQETDGQEADENHIEGQMTIDEVLEMFNLNVDGEDEPAEKYNEAESLELEEISEEQDEIDSALDQMFDELADNGKEEPTENEETDAAETAEAEEAVVEEEITEEGISEEGTSEEEIAEDEISEEDTSEEEITEDEISEEDIEETEAAQENKQEEAVDEAEEELELTQERGEESETVIGEEKNNDFVKRHLSDTAKQELKKFISRFAGVKGIDKQILKAMNSVLKASATESCFVFIIGDVKSGKTTLAIDIIKVLNKVMENRGRKIAKIPGSSLSGKNMGRLMERIAESDIVVEKVSSMGEESFTELVKEVRKSKEAKIVLFEDEAITSEKFVRDMCQKLNLGDNIIMLRQSRVNEWAKIAQDYVAEQGYDIDEMGILALHERIDKLYALTLVIQKTHVEQVIDMAIKKHNKKKLLNLFRGSKSNVLTERDFIED